MSDDALLKFDFVRAFPHKMWISDWASDEQYPDGFRYKLMSARCEPDDIIELLIVLQRRNGDKEVLSSLEVKGTAFEGVAAVFASGLTESYNLDFEVQDFSSCRTMEEFLVAADQFGWTSKDQIS